jgi:sirohydrochlorin cobaltochelatase
VSTGALLLGHGSPDQVGRAELSSLRELVGRRLGFEIGLGVLEFGCDDLPGLDAAFAAQRGREPVAAQPLILFDGLHGRHDLPYAAAAATARLGLDVRLGGAFGGDPELVALASSRLRASDAGQGDLLLFVGRGSSEPLARRQTERVAEIVAREVGTEWLVCYAGISRPDLVEGMELALGRAPDRVLALPYLLHTGVLVRRVSEILAPLAARARADLLVLPHIGNAPELVEVVAGRLERLL